jgi:CRISPR-associated protein Cmr2
MRHLLLIRTGPVQAFIQQARRTRDLWFGSHLLSEISKAAAKAIAEREGARLVFPALKRGERALEPADGPRLDDGSATPNVANKILALVEGDPATVARAAREAANDGLRQSWARLRDKEPGLIDPHSLDAALEQVDSFLEFHAAFAPCADDAAYANARRLVEAELDAHKTLHAFAPWVRQRGGVHKSSLDGARETVLRGGARTDRAFQQYRIGTREQLDAIGLLKRAGGAPDQFVPVPTVGLAAWLELANKHCETALNKLAEECHGRRFQPVNRKDLEWLEPFPFDAQIFLPDRWAPYFADLQIADPDEPRRFGKKFVRPILDRLAEPHPYVACLVADGDWMGRAIDKLASPDAHEQFSRRLAAFPADARRILEVEHKGVLVYAGGDDVLGFVCPTDAVRCAEALRRAFEERMRQALPDAPDMRPTLSVGLGFGHVLQSLGDLLDLGRAAAKAAKDGGRDALSIVVEKHAGARSASWTSFRDDPAARWQADIELVRRLSMKKVHQVAALSRRAPAPDATRQDAKACAHMLRGEALATLARSEPGGARLSLSPAELGLHLEEGDYAQIHEQLTRWTERMLIANFLGRAEPRLAGGVEA